MSDASSNGDTHVLLWSGKLFSADDLRRHWKGQRELILPARSLLTPLVIDELRAKGVRITRQDAPVKGAHVASGQGWSYVEETPEPMVRAAAAALAHDGLALSQLAAGVGPRSVVGLISDWIGKHAGCVMFSADAALWSCLANKRPGLRAAAVQNPQQARRALKTFAANVLVVETAGRTFFEVRQILRTAATGPAPRCPTEIAGLLAELDSHADR